MQQKNIYKPIELANIFGIHSNTIRLYEKWGFISKAHRAENGYRIFTNVHLYQIKLCRCIFGHPFTTSTIRHIGNKVIEASAKCDIPLCHIYTDEYIAAIRKEIKTARQTAEILQKWLDNNKTLLSNDLYSRKQAAEILGTTVETIRNWERNGMILSDKTGVNNERLFDANDIERLHVIYMLRQAGYSMFSILRCMEKYDNGEKNLVLETLDNPGEEEDLLSVGDRWTKALSALEQAAMAIPPLLEQMKVLPIK